MKRGILIILFFTACHLYGQDTITNRLITVDNWFSSVSFLLNDTSDYFVSVPLSGMQNDDASSHALFLDPVTYELYGMFDTIYNDNMRSIYKLNPLSGELELVLNLNDFFSAADITPEGRVFGILGNGTSHSPAAIYEINLKTGAIDFVVQSMVPFEEPRAIFYYPPANQLWVYTGFLEKIYTYELDTWEQDSIVAPIGEGEGEEIHGTFFKNDTLLVSNYSGVIWYIPTVITNDTLPEAVYINEMPQNVMDLVELKLIGSREERGLCPNLEAPDTLYALYASKSYQWYRDGETLENDTLDRVAMDTEGEYQLLTEIDSSGNMIFSEVITVSHATVPTVTITASATALCPGDEITLTGSAGGSSQWYRNGEAIEGATSNVYVATETGWYNMIKTNQSGCSDSAAVGIAIVAEDPLVCNPEATVTKSVESGIKIYPTVTDGIIWIENNSGTEVMVSVFTITGNQVANVRSAGEQKISADLTSCADGLYIVQLMAGDMVRTQRIIKE